MLTPPHDLHCQHDWIWSHQGDTPLSVSVQVLPEKTHWEGRAAFWEEHLGHRADIKLSEKEIYVSSCLYSFLLCKHACHCFSHCPLAPNSSLSGFPPWSQCHGLSKGLLDHQCLICIFKVFIFVDWAALPWVICFSDTNRAICGFSCPSCSSQSINPPQCTHILLVVFLLRTLYNTRPDSEDSHSNEVSLADSTEGYSCGSFHGLNNECVSVSSIR